MTRAEFDAVLLDLGGDSNVIVLYFDNGFKVTFGINGAIEFDSTSIFLGATDIMKFSIDSTGRAVDISSVTDKNVFYEYRGLEHLQLLVGLAQVKDTKYLSEQANSLYL
ncbi:MAG: hypothetical protein PHF63_00215 [Herbinix sp.]|nr:hypothetical protein [Herbinix sp.]